MKNTAKGFLVAITLASGACHSNPAPYPYVVGPEGFSLHSTVFWGGESPQLLIENRLSESGTS